MGLQRLGPRIMRAQPHWHMRNEPQDPKAQKPKAQERRTQQSEAAAQNSARMGVILVCIEDRRVGMYMEDMQHHTQMPGMAMHLGRTGGEQRHRVAIDRCTGARVCVAAAGRGVGKQRTEQVVARNDLASDSRQRFQTLWLPSSQTLSALSTAIARSSAPSTFHVPTVGSAEMERTRTAPPTASSPPSATDEPSG